MCIKILLYIHICVSRSCYIYIYNVHPDHGILKDDVMGDVYTHIVYITARSCYVVM